MPPDDDTIARQVAAILPAARWFATKGAAIDRVTIHDRVAVPAPRGSHASPLSLLLVDVHVAGVSPPNRYCLVVDDAGHDAASTPVFAHWLAGAMLGDQRIETRHGTVIGHGTGSAANPDPAAVPVVASVGGDASNTSFIVRLGGSGFVVKLLRRCRPGIQPEVEVGEFLATQAEWRGSPRLRGWLEYMAADGTSTALATVHDLASDCTTAWEWLVGRLVSGGPAAAVGDDVRGVVAQIGLTTAEMHRALAARPDIPAFAPQPPTPASRREMAARMADHAASVFSLVESRLPLVAPPLALRLRRVLAGRDALLGRFDGLEALAVDVPIIRVHGDYHLGQVLVGTRDDRVLVIDFEGEPGRSLDERRTKACAAKDVAGMCRSLDYLVRCAAADGGGCRVEDGRRLERVFLEAYRSGVAGQPWWPADAARAGALLDIHRLDKAVYELAYEINNRPDWIDVPLAALEEIAATPGRSHA